MLGPEVETYVPSRTFQPRRFFDSGLRRAPSDSLQKALFPGYLFTPEQHVPEITSYKIPQVISILKFGQTEARIPQQQIDQIRLAAEHPSVEIVSEYKPGQRIRQFCASGALEGELQEGPHKKLVLWVDFIGRGLAIPFEPDKAEVL